MTSDTQRRQPSPSSRKHQSKSGSNNHSSSDGYYGHEDTAKMAAGFITSLFACPESPPPSTNVTSTGAPVPSPKLANFVAYALHRTRLASSVTYAALFLLQRLKTRFPAARGSSGHRLFISAFMIASKVVCDDTYSNKSWAVVGQGMFSLREINQMEREMCGYLEWQLNIAGSELESFSDDITQKHGSPALLANYMHSKPAPSPAAIAVAAAYESSSSASTSHHHHHHVAYPSPNIVPVVSNSTGLDGGLKPAAGRNGRSHSPATVVSTYVESVEELEDIEPRLSPNSSPESDMVSTPTSAHGGDDSTHIVSHESSAQGVARSFSLSSAAGASASKHAPPPVVKMEAGSDRRASMVARGTVW